MYLLTPAQNYKINILAGFVTAANSELYSAFNPSEEEKELLVEEWMNDSDFDSTAILTSEHTVITLSTCSYEYSNARYVIIGVLEKL